MTTLHTTVRYRVTGMDCSSCTTKIEAAARRVAGVDDVGVSIASQQMPLRLRGKTAPLPELERTIGDLGYQLTRLSDEDEDDKRADLAHVTPPAADLQFCDGHFT